MTTPNVHQVAVEQVIHELIADNPELPIRGEFYRGISTTPLNLGHAAKLGRKAVPQTTLGTN